MNIIKEVVTTEYKQLMWITLGSFLVILGINLFLVPAGIFSTGITGFAYEITYILNMAFDVGDVTSIVYLLLNIPLILLGWFKVGKKFTFRTFYSIIVIAIFISIIPTDVELLTDPLLASITSGILIGAGAGITLKYGASTGGTDILALYIALVKKTGFGVYNVCINSIVIILAIILLKDFTVGVLMLINLYTASLIIDKIHNYHQKKSLFIVTNKPEEIKDAIYSTSGRGVTIIPTVGGHTKKDNFTIFTTISHGEEHLIIESVKEVDELAWINIFPVEKVVGYFEDNYRNKL